LVTSLPRPSLTTGSDTEKNLAIDVMTTGNLFSIGDILKQKKMKCEELSMLKTISGYVLLSTVFFSEIKSYYYYY